MDPECCNIEEEEGVGAGRCRLQRAQSGCGSLVNVLFFRARRWVEAFRRGHVAGAFGPLVLHEGSWPDPFGHLI